MGTVGRRGPNIRFRLTESRLLHVFHVGGMTDFAVVRRPADGYKLAASGGSGLMESQ